MQPLVSCCHLLSRPARSLNCHTKIDGAGVPGDWRRIAVCLPRSGRLPNRLRIGDDVVVLDEAGLLRRFFGSELMNHKIQKTYDRLSVIVANAPTVVVTQWRLTRVTLVSLQL
jgi:hypothetical protein